MRDTTSQTKQKEVVSHATFLWRLSSCKKSNWLIPSIGIDNQRSLQSDWMSGTTGHTQPKEVVSHVTFLWGLSLCKKSKRLTDSFPEILMINEQCNVIGWEHFRHGVFAESKGTMLYTILG